MKKNNKLFLFLPVTFLSALALTGCNSESDVRVLRILNCEDYIYEYDPKEDVDYQIEKGDMSDEEYVKYKNNYKMDMIEQFVEYWAYTHDDEEIQVVYDTFDTNETMFNELKTGKTTYDVIVPSDYMIQKLLSNDMLEKFDTEKLPDLWENISPYLKEKFTEITAKNGENVEKIYDYSIPYMWGTVGLMYNPHFYGDLEEDRVHELFTDWDSLYGEELKGSFSIKDSVRDTYAVSLIHAFREEIEGISDNSALAEVFNRHDVNTMAKVKEDMLNLKENAFGFECDSGKTDMTTEKIGANMCWSGDATWAIEEAEGDEENEGLTLYYSIPTASGDNENGGASNVWFDGFCMPKSEKLDKELAQEFIKFMSQPENAVQNCYCVGYTPAVAGDDMLEYMYECYDVRGEIGGDETGLVEGEDYIKYDLSYFYDGSLSEWEELGPDERSVLWAIPDYVGRQLTAQYPSSDILPRLAVMNDFGPEGNARLLDMWEQVRTNALPTWGIIILAVEGVAAIAFGIYLLTHKVNRKKFKKERTSK